MKCHFGSVELAIKRGTYHPLKEYSLLKKKFTKGQKVSFGKFHKLAKKLEQSIPHSMRSASGTLTTELLLEIINEEKF